jgi:hypothetical protein
MSYNIMPTCQIHGEKTAAFPHSAPVGESMYSTNYRSNNTMLIGNIDPGNDK